MAREKGYRTRGLDAVTWNTPSYNPDEAMNTVILDRLSALADATRCRMLLLLETQELSVSELWAVLQLPQSTVSRHLKVLADEGWVEARADGTSHLYSIPHDRLAPGAAKLWDLVKGDAGADPAAAEDARRLEAVLAERHRKSQEFFASEAGQWDRLREELFGARSELFALAGLLDPSWVVGDLGCGTAHLAAAIAPFVKRVIAVDESSAMLDGARARVGALANVDLRRGQIEALPVADGELDVAVLGLVLPYAVSPAAVVAEAARALGPGGRLLIVDLAPHDRPEYRKTMGHLRQGVSRSDLGDWMHRAGFQLTQYGVLPASPVALGPALFLAAGTSRVAEPTARGVPS